MAASFGFKVVRATSYLKAIMEVYGKTVIGLGPEAQSWFIAMVSTLIARP